MKGQWHNLQYDEGGHSTEEEEEEEEEEGGGLASVTAVSVVGSIYVVTVLECILATYSAEELGVLVNHLFHFVFDAPCPFASGA